MSDELEDLRQRLKNITERHPDVPLAEVNKLREAIAYREKEQKQ